MWIELIDGMLLQSSDKFGKAGVPLFVDLFVNLSIIIALIFTYLQLKWQLFKRLKLNDKVSHLINGIAGGMLGLILLRFSIQVGDSTYIDLRYLPIILVTLHGGFRPAILSGAIIMAGRFYINHTYSAYMALLLMIISLTGFLLIRHYAKRGQPLYVTGASMVLFSNIAFTIVISLLIGDWDKLKVLFPNYWLFATVGGMASIFFVEHVRHSQYLLDKYELESTTDYLTGLNNVRQFDVMWNELIHGAVQRGENLSLLAIDIDHFKKVNDTYGHAGGDLVLAELAKVLRDNARSFDIVSRNGGEEFSVILQDCSKERALIIAERIRQGVEDHHFPLANGERIQITISIGVATYPETVYNPDQMREVADQCLYEAKRTGRNRVCTASAEQFAQK
ncbi:diguanylate cyclase [Aciduricibacillus chroicocephali]|uniref:Diguanylate cyclase n=1 Tax=Aciduricibacillus chroicocephali TaxID=3054939 RepID=A0ABY9KUK4_9BACI|nr:diguanylate cyclase [Bacillaceae bacterium 44XB]